MTAPRSCSDSSHKTVVDVVAKEVICVNCGIVLEEQTTELKMQLSSADEQESISTQTFPEKKGLITSLGSQLQYISAAQPGEIFKDCNPYGVKDYAKKRCDPIMTSNVGVPYQIAKSFGGNGDWDESGMKFIVDYKKDSWFRQTSIKRYELCERYQIEEGTRERLASKDLKGYSNIVIELLPEMISRLNIHMMPKGRLKPIHRGENRIEAVILLEKLGAILSKMLDKGDRIADTEDGYDVDESDLETVDNSKRKTIDILEGRGGYHYNDDLDVGGI